MDESRLDDFPAQDFPADRRWITFGIGSLVLSLACGLVVPNGAAWAFLITVAFIAQVVTDVDQLPIRVASHFTFDLHADGWLNRSSYLILMAAMGPSISLTSAAWLSPQEWRTSILSVVICCGLDAIPWYLSTPFTDWS